jgi:hypothetical protein
MISHKFKKSKVSAGLLARRVPPTTDLRLLRNEPLTIGGEDRRREGIITRDLLRVVDTRGVVPAPRVRFSAWRPVGGRLELVLAKDANDDEKTDQKIGK